MTRLPPRDTVDFAAGVTLGVLLGWGVTVLLTSDDEPPPTPARRFRLPALRRPPPPPKSFLEELRDAAGALVRGAGEELAGTAARSLRDSLLGSGTKR